MAWGKTNTESNDGANRVVARRQSTRRRKWKLWLTVLLLVGGAVWLLFNRPENPKARGEREVRRILSAVRRQDRAAFNPYSLIEVMKRWPRPFPQLASMLLGPEYPTYEAAQNLAALGRLAVPILTNTLAGDRSAVVRSTAAEALGEMGDSRLSSVFRAAFEREKDARVQSSILGALGWMDDEELEPFLISVLQGTNSPQVRADAVNALRTPQLPQTLSALTHSLASDSDPLVRQRVARALTFVPDPIAKSALLQAFSSSSDSSVCSAAARALRGHPGNDTAAIMMAAVTDSIATGQVLAAAVSTLREMTNATVRPFLLETLKHAMPEVRSEAARALGDFTGTDIEVALIDSLASDPETNVREAAANALGELAGSPTNRDLLSALVHCLQHDPEPKVRAAAASALNDIGGEEVVNSLTAALQTERRGEVQVAAIGGLYQHRGPEITSFLLRLADDANLTTEARAEVVQCLGRTLAPSATSKLVSLLKQDPEEAVRMAAASALGLLDNTNAVAALKQVLERAKPVANQPDDSSVRREAAAALGGMSSARTPETVSALVTVLSKESNDSIRTSLVTSLGLLRVTNTLPALMAVLRHDSSRDVRAEAATALGKLGCVAAIPRLETAFNRDRDRKVRANAVRSLARLASADRAEFFISVFEADPTLRAELADVLGCIGSPEAVAVLLKSLNEDGCVNRAAVAKALGIAGDARAAATLIRILTNERDLKARDAAVMALGWLGSPEAVPALENALQDRNRSIHQEAAWALGHIGDARAVVALSQALTNRDSNFRFAAAFALAEVGAREAIPAIAPLLEDSNDFVRLAAASALAFMDDTQGLTVLSNTLHSKDEWQRFTALISLLRLNTPETQRLLAKHNDSDPTLAACIQAGLRLGGPGAATNMLCTAKVSESMTEDYRHFGARALVLFNDPATLPALRANANDPREEVRAAVRVAIRRIQKKIAAGNPRPINL